MTAAEIGRAPRPPALGKDGRWVRLGAVGVDSASIGVVDPGMFHGPGKEMPADALSISSTVYSVETWAGFGDGEYEVWGWIVDYGDNAGERVAQIVVTLIDDAELAEWRAS